MDSRNINPKFRVKFLKEASLDNTPITPGSLIATMDTGNVYLDIFSVNSDNKRINVSGYSKEEINSLLSDYALKSELPTDYLTDDDLAGYAQTSEIPTTTSDLTNDSGFITNTVNDLANYTLSSDLATVATSGSYDDLTNKPVIITSYNDLTDKPDIPQEYTLPTASTTVLGGVIVDGTTITIEDGVITSHATSTEGTSDYATLTNKPQIGGVELAGNKTLAELGIQAAGDYITGSTLTDYALKTELAAKQDTLTAGTNINITENVIKEYVPVVVLSSSAGTKNLETNSVYSLSAPTGTITFSLPTPADNTEFNQILVQLNMTTVRTINVGTSYFFNKTAPDLSSVGVYDLVWEYDKANGYWVCGLLSKGVE